MDEKNRHAESEDYPTNPEPIIERPTGLHTHWPEPEWWRRRVVPVSGRYEGLITYPRGPRRTGNAYLILRVDIDPRRNIANSPVLNRISGDFYQVFSFEWPPGERHESLFYLESWIVDRPRVLFADPLQVSITGRVRFWEGGHPETRVRIAIPYPEHPGVEPGPADVTFDVARGRSRRYICTWRSDCFRDLTMEVDVCQSVNAEPILPSYPTPDHPSIPRLTIEEAYREAGVCVTIRPDRTVIDDSADEFATWSVSELHDAMETHYSLYIEQPKWRMWGLLAGRYDRASVAGIMFDAAAVYGGAGEPPDRQGFAVFRNHSWFNNLVAGEPANQAEAEAMRQFLYTWVHEAGHAFNFLHSWNKGRPDALSWMNYPQRVTDFWNDFRFRFDDEELIHLRHGDRASVIPGGDPWASGGHLEAPSGAMSQLEGKAPIELLLRSKGYFEFMEPVVIEFRLRNLLDDLPLDLDTQLSPEYGGVIVHIRRPDGRIVKYAPILCKLVTPQIQTLKPRKGAVQGEDRYSEDVFLSYGKYGFYFDEPGEYLVRAMYQGTGDVLIPSNIHRVRVGNPPSKEEDQIAQDFFTYQAGMNLYLGGSRSPFLAKGMELLESIADRYKDALLGAKVATTLANSVARPFFRIQDGVLTKMHSADPKKGLALTKSALTLYKREKVKPLNIAYHQLVRRRAGYMITIGQNAEAKKEVAALRKDLTARGVNEPVLNEIKAYEETL